MKLVIIDVFDSFTYNLMHICEKYVKNVCGGRKLDNNRYYNKLFIDLIEI